MFDPNMLGNMSEMMKNPEMVKQMEDMMKNPDIMNNAMNMLNNPNMANLFGGMGGDSSKNPPEDTGDTGDTGDISVEDDRMYNEGDNVKTTGLKSVEYNDTECVVTGYNTTTNRYTVMIGSLDKSIAVKEEHLEKNEPVVVDID